MGVSMLVKGRRTIVRMAVAVNQKGSPVFKAWRLAAGPIYVHLRWCF